MELAPCRTSIAVREHFQQRLCDVVLPPCPHGVAPVPPSLAVRSCAAGSAIMSLLRDGFVPAVGNMVDECWDEGEEWSLDDEALLRMEERLDAEGGWDAFNEDTFGSNCDVPWEFGELVPGEDANEYD